MYEAAVLPCLFYACKTWTAEMLDSSIPSILDASGSCSVSSCRTKSRTLKYSSVLGWSAFVPSYCAISSGELDISAEWTTVASQRDCSMVSYPQASAHLASQRCLTLKKSLKHCSITYSTREKSAQHRAVWRSLVKVLSAWFWREKNHWQRTQTPEKEKIDRVPLLSLVQSPASHVPNCNRAKIGVISLPQQGIRK